MSLTLVNNGDSGLVAREKINDAITAINNLVLSGSFTTSGTSGVSGTSGISGTEGGSGTSGINGINGINGSSGTSGLSGTSGTSGTGAPEPGLEFSSYQNQPTATISGSADSAGACTAVSTNIYLFDTYLTKGPGNVAATPQVGDFAFSDDTFTTPVPQFGTASFYGYKDSGIDSHYKIVGIGGAVTEIGVCSSPPPPPPPPALTSFTIFTEGGAPMVISGSATSEAACGQVSTGFNMRTAYLQKTAPNTDFSVQEGDFVFEDEAGTNPIDSFNGNSFYGFTVAPGATAKTFNVTGFTGQVVTVNFC